MNELALTEGMDSGNNVKVIFNLIATTYVEELTMLALRGRNMITCYI